MSGGWGGEMQVLGSGGSPVLLALVLEVVHVAALGGVHRVLRLAVLGQGVSLRRQQGSVSGDGRGSVSGDSRGSVSGDSKGSVSGDSRGQSQETAGG